MVWKDIHVTVINDSSKATKIVNSSSNRYSGQSKEERLCAESNVVDDEIHVCVCVCVCVCAKYLARLTKMFKNCPAIDLSNSSKNVSVVLCIVKMTGY